MAVTLVYLDDNPGQSATGGNPNGTCIGQHRKIRVKATFDDDTGTITSRYNIVNVEGLPGGAAQVVTNTFHSGSVALTDVPEMGTPYFLTIVCSN